ncbi:MAG: phosphoenolpyruvate kinase [Phycisphaerales bacterium]|nr:phosphoenolpyruvate kinase [Phycisphaerales bacterium]
MAVTRSLDPDILDPLLTRLNSENSAYARVYPGEPIGRQPVHTIYGGGHLFRRDSARRLGDLALASMAEYGPDAESFARAIGFEGETALERSVYERVVDKLKREPVEDFRIDFEDGYGTREEAEEDAHAAQAAVEVAQGMKAGTLPPFIGIRIKNFGLGTCERGIRTLDIFLTALSGLTGGKLPENFVVMLPKLVAAGQVRTMVELFETFEGRGGEGLFPRGSLKMEFMVETTQSVIDSNGACPLPEFVRASKGRCIAAALGVYDYTASLGITANQQRIDHRGCDFARHVMQVALGGSGLFLSDGATNIMPTPPHAVQPGASLTSAQREENARTVHDAWKLNFGHVRRSLMHGWYQGWDLNPAQLPVRYAAVYSYFLEYLPEATRRLRNFVEKAARATLVRSDSGVGVFDDAATAQGLLTFFIQGLRRRAISDEDLAATGVTREEIATRSFNAIVRRRLGTM